ncbi:hypothetical protein Tco_0085212 [Tanacetum coccineum]
MNITSPSSSLEQINFGLEDWGTNPSDSSIEFSFRTCSVVIEANGLEQDKFPSSVGLDFRALLDGGQMYSRHLEAMRLP